MLAALAAAGIFFASCENPADATKKTDDAVAVKGSVTGTLTLPDLVTNKNYVVILDTDRNYANGITAENARAWLDAGAFAVGVNAAIFAPDLLARRDFAAITAKSRAVLAAVAG